MEEALFAFNYVAEISSRYQGNQVQAFAGCERGEMPQKTKEALSHVENAARLGKNLMPVICSAVERFSRPLAKSLTRCEAFLVSIRKHRLVIHQALGLAARRFNSFLN